ncbi:MAG: hypothetical protein JHD28_01090, partial [Bacteroidia bacterium]|nr:hypothetical protein [Bacteroidia bacterium]
IEDLAMLSHEVLQPNNELSNIEKEVLKRTCSDLFELVLKLKTSNDLSDEHIALKENISQEIRKEELNFKEIIANKIISEEVTINTLAETKLVEEEQIETLVNPIINAPVEDIVAPINEQVEVQELIGEVPQVQLFTFNQEPEVVGEKESLIINVEPILEEPMAVIELPEESPVFDLPTVEPEKVKEESFEMEATTPNLPDVITETAPDFTEDVILPIAAPVLEIKTVIEEPKPVEPKPIMEESANKPNPFFSIGKTVMPSSEPSLNERIAQKMDGFQFSEKMVEPKIDSLKTAISLNKKIAFVNELFKENVVEYAKSIDKINNANGLNEALLFWGEMKIAHNWNNENPLVKDMEKLIQRRFS